MTVYDNDGTYDDDKTYDSDIDIHSGIRMAKIMLIRALRRIGFMREIDHHPRSITHNGPVRMARLTGLKRTIVNV